MNGLKGKKVDTGLGILLICLFSTIYILVGYIVIMNNIGWF